MSVTAEKLVEEAKLFRESGHCSRSAQILDLAKARFPADDRISREEKKLKAAVSPSFPRCRWALAWMVDILGLPAFFMVMALVAWLIGPILFVESL
jgi:hypothetical protein